MLLKSNVAKFKYDSPQFTNSETSIIECSWLVLKHYLLASNDLEKIKSSSEILKISMAK